MRVFIENIKCIKHSLKIFFMVGVALVIVFYSIAALSGNFMDVTLLVKVFFLFGIMMPVLFLLIGFLRWYYDYRINITNFNSAPFNELAKIGFEKFVLNKNSKSDFFSERFRKYIKSVLVECYTETRDNPELITFVFFVKLDGMERFEMNIIGKDLEKKGLIMNWKGQVEIKYHHKKHPFNSIYELENELIQILDLLIQKKFAPLD